MLQKDNRMRILQVFFDDPIPTGIGYQLREISRNVSLAPTSVKRYLNELEREKLVIKEKHRIHKYPIYFANRDNEYFKSLKRMDMLIRIEESGLLNYLNNKCLPEVIILFGSASRGEDIKDSDIDLFLLCKEEKLDIRRYEKALNRKISLFFSGNFNSLSKELKNNILNGTILAGYLKVF